MDIFDNDAWFDKTISEKNIWKSKFGIKNIENIKRLKLLF